MTSGLAWLNDLMLWLGRWFPRLILIKATHQGVQFGRAGAVKTLLPGLYCYWPITSNVEVVSTRLRTSEISAQLIGREVVSIAIQYAIVNPRQAVCKLNDVFSQLDDRSQALLTANYHPSKSNTEIEELVHAALQREFKSIGVSIYMVGVIQRGRVIPLKNIGDWAQHAVAKLE